MPQYHTPRIRLDWHRVSPSTLAQAALDQLHLLPCLAFRRCRRARPVHRWSGAKSAARVADFPPNGTKGTRRGGVSVFTATSIFKMLDAGHRAPLRCMSDLGQTLEGSQAEGGLHYRTQVADLPCSAMVDVLQPLTQSQESLSRLRSSLPSRLIPRSQQSRQSGRARDLLWSARRQRTNRML